MLDCKLNWCLGSELFCPVPANGPVAPGLKSNSSLSSVAPPESVHQDSGRTVAHPSMPRVLPLSLLPQKKLRSAGPVPSSMVRRSS